ncbi:MAG: DUF3459 domain-containing protein [Verrucomicrobia bacterium]|nr:DUF3459 domain-containing protein [Verrucomicrobiota bacterium]
MPSRPTRGSSPRPTPHADNLAYFGDGTNEAQLVYNFALPPLVLHALLRGDARTLTAWAATLRTPSDQTTFFNFVASHDGIGLNPVRGILPPAEIQFLVERCRAHGGLIGLKQNPDGSTSPYELNIVYFDAVNDPAAEEPLAIQVRRFLVSQAILLSLAGVPGIYFHSLFGSRNDTDGARSSGIPRRINRQKLPLAELRAELAQPGSLRAVVFRQYRELLRVRRGEPAFAPRAPQRIWDVDRRVFAVERTADAGRSVLCLHNVSDQRVMLDLVSQVPGVLNPRRDLDRWPQGAPGSWVDLLAKASEATPMDGVARCAPDGRTRLVLEPYAVRWLAAAGLGVRQLVAAG